MWLSLATDPLGRFAFAAASVFRIWSHPMSYFVRAFGLTSTRTAGRDAPIKFTWPTPGTWANFWPRIESATSYILLRSTVSDVRAITRIGKSDGFVFR